MDQLSVLQRLGGGTLIERLHEALVQTAQEVVETGNPGTVTLAFKITTQEQGEPLVAILETIGRTPPKRSPRGTILYALGGELHREDPRQIKMEFRSIDPKTGEIREPDIRQKVERAIL